MQNAPCKTSNAQKRRLWTWLRKMELSENIAYMSPSDDSVLGHDTLDKLGVLFCHVLSIFLFAEPRLTVSTDGETEKSLFLRGSIGYGRLTGRRYVL